MRLKIALSKGRILKQILPVFERAGLELAEHPEKSRKLVIPVRNSEISVVIVRATDAPTYVRLGAADLGVVGKDVLMETGGSDLYELFDTGLARCRLSLAQLSTATNTNRPGSGKVKVATKYENISREYFASMGIQSEIIKLYGSMELAPHAGLCDRIVDLVDSGNTLKANNLVETHTIAHISARLVANKVAYKLKREQLLPLIDKLKQAI
jgi:ATP phosphoribosyltransferase